MLQKLSGSRINSAFSCDWIFALPMMSIYSENGNSNRLFWSWRGIFTVRHNLLTLRHRYDSFKHALITFAYVARELTGNVCVKSLHSSSRATPKSLVLFLNSFSALLRPASECLRAIVHILQIIILHFLKTLAMHECFFMLHIASACVGMFNGSLNCESAVRSQSSKVTAMPDEAIDSREKTNSD